MNSHSPDTTLAAAPRYTLLQTKQEDPITHTLNDTLMILAELEVKPDWRDAFLAYVAGHLPVSRANSGNLQSDMLLDAARPERVLFYEVWESPAAQQAYLACAKPPAPVARQVT